MRLIFTALALLLSISSWADSSPSLPLGTFKFQNIQVLSIKHYEAVPSLNKNRLKELRSQGYTCELTALDIYQCATFDKNLVLPEPLRQRLLTEVSSEVVTFQPFQGVPTLESDGDTVKEWKVSQTLVINGQTYPAYRYQIGQGVQKITPLLGDAPQPLALIVVSGTQLWDPRTFTQHESGHRHTQYFLALELNR